MVTVPERSATSSRTPYHRRAFRGFGFLGARPEAALKATHQPSAQVRREWWKTAGW